MITLRIGITDPCYHIMEVWLYQYQCDITDPCLLEKWMHFFGKFSCLLERMPLFVGKMNAVFAWNTSFSEPYTRCIFNLIDINKTFGLWTLVISFVKHTYYKEINGKNTDFLQNFSYHCLLFSRRHKIYKFK